MSELCDAAIEAVEAMLDLRRREAKYREYREASPAPLAPPSLVRGHLPRRRAAEGVARANARLQKAIERYEAAKVTVPRTMQEEPMDDIAKELDRAIGTGWRDQPLFDLGLVVCSPGANEAACRAELPDQDKAYTGCWRPYLERHRRADWPGEAISEHERQMNLSAIESGERIVGAYELPRTGRRVLVVTDAEIVTDGWRHRPGTTILLPEEYR